MKEIINLRDPIRTEIWSRPAATQHYQETNEPYKVELIEAIPGDEPLRMYWHGDWQDLCRGPHLQHTGQVPGDSFKLMSIAGAYWRGDSDRAMLQRIYGVAFTGKEKLRAHLNMLEEAAKRDHRKLGREMDLFHMQEEAPGQVFWHPNGWLIYTQLQDYMRRKQRAGGYVEVNTPQVVDRKLWEHASHWYNIQAWLPKNMVIVNNDAWAKLDEATQKVVLEKAAAAEARGWAKAEELANWYVEELAKNGMKVGPAGDQLKADFAKIGETMTTEWLAKAGDTGKAAVDAYKAQ